MSADGSNQKNLAYPRITPEYLESLIVSEEYQHFPSTRTTTVSIKLDTGYSQTESVVCSNAQLYDEITGKQHAKSKAMRIIQEKEYYAMRRVLFMLKQLSEGKSNG